MQIVNKNKHVPTGYFNKFSPHTIRLFKSVWFFPLILALPLVVLTVFKINGSSIGVYHSAFYGDTKDNDLLLNKPRPIRSDEWLVNSQMIIAQRYNNFERVNKNIGNGEDVSLLIDVPYKDWSTIFRPHNLGFFVLPFDNAFAFRWWAMAYLLVVSCYFFIIQLLPKKKLLAALLASGLLFSPFIQWWYLYGTIGSIYYSLFGGVAFIKILKQKSLIKGLLWGLLLAYFAVCFVLLLYPPFQIPCALVLLAFVVGYFIEWKKGVKPRLIWQKIGVIFGAVLITGVLVLSFLASRHEIINTIQNTAYPGRRSINSGGFDLGHLLSSHLSPQFQYTSRANYYRIADKGIYNQSETANFILLIPFLLLPGIFLLGYRYRKTKEIDWPLLFTSALFILFLTRLYVPYFDRFYKLLLLDKVPQKRLLIGVGLLGVIHLILIVRNLDKKKKFKFNGAVLVIYTVLVLIVEIALSYYARRRFPGFIGTEKVWLFSLPLPIITYLILSKRFVLAALGLLLFSGYSSAVVNPMYRGTGVITQSPLSREIRRLSNNNDYIWVTEDIYTENFAVINGAPSLSSVYTYPQLELWKPIDNGSQQDIYNRYAHVFFQLDRNPNLIVATELDLVGGDNFHVISEPCSDFLRKNNVRFLVTEAKLNGQDSCAHLIDTINYPLVNFFIYQLNG